jgi:glycyl-tRNA synthetase beta chain
MSDFLLEIGTEEIPHWMVPGALKQLATMDTFGESVSVDGTPRRLVLRARGVRSVTFKKEEWISGPSKSAGTGAIAGFAKKMGITPEQLELRAGPKGEYYGYIKTTAEKAVADLLAELIPGFILALDWPKTMYWESKAVRFIRPLRWIVALLDDKVIDFAIGSVKSGNLTRGHRQLGSPSIPVTCANYESELQKNFVILSSQTRRERISTSAAALGAKLEDDLLETLTFITEFPTAIRGDFDPAFLELPAEVLTTVLRHHQKTFSVESAPGVLAPHFVAIMNTSADPDGWVKLGNERVIKARFNDARFFWNVDQQKKLADRVEDLKKVTFLRGLGDFGSYYAKTERIVNLVRELNGGPDAEKAALLCKTDLTTEMVKEFTDLQGIVGGLYARRQNENEAVAQAIREHYKPLSMEDSIPSTREGQIVALADKVDTLRECFKIGLAPTGSKDPFALRRAALGVVRILAECSFDFGIGHLFEGEAFRFVDDRARFFFESLNLAQFDVLNAVQKANREQATVAGMKARLALVEEFRDSPLVASVKRTANILKDFTPPPLALDPSLMEAGAETELYSAFQRILPILDGHDDRAKVIALDSLVPQIDRFFENVMVNAEAERVRTNRKTLLYAILNESRKIADFSEIVTAGDK